MWVREGGFKQEVSERETNKHTKRWDTDPENVIGIIGIIRGLDETSTIDTVF